MVNIQIIRNRQGEVIVGKIEWESVRSENASALLIEGIRKAVDNFNNQKPDEASEVAESPAAAGLQSSFVPVTKLDKTEDEGAFKVPSVSIDLSSGGTKRDVAAETKDEAPKDEVPKDEAPKDEAPSAEKEAETEASEGIKPKKKKE